jgi:hypothetical protein
MTKLLTLFLSVLSFVAYSQDRSELTIPPNGDNQKAEVSQWIGLVKITITYNSPDVHAPSGADRKGHIWGELVHYGFADDGFGPSTAIPWRAGANETTTISFSHDVKIAGSKVKAGTYGLFIDVQSSGPWNFILSTQLGWGSFQYDPKFDVIRIPSEAADASYTEWLTYGFDDRKPGSTVAYMQWENKRVAFKIEVPDAEQLYLDEIRKDLLGWAGFTAQNWTRAAQYCLANNMNLDEALVWAEKAVTEPFRNATLPTTDFTSYHTKATVLIALKRTDEAMAVMEPVMKFPNIAAFEYFQYSRTLLNAGKSPKALEVAQTGNKKYPNDFWPYVAMARCYAAMGDKKNGVKNWETAIHIVPPTQTTRVAAYNAELEKLRESK